VQTSLPDEEIVRQEIDNETLKNFTTNLFSGFGNLLKQFYLFEALYTHTIKLEGHYEFSFYSELYNHRIDSHHSFVLDMWNLAYSTIRNLNFAIDMMLKRTDNYNFSDYIHTAKVFRSYAYFLMINYWDDVPYLDELTFNNVEEAMNISRMDKGEILNLLIAQLLEAESKLPETETEHILSMSYVWLILSKIYTYQANYAKALEYTKKIIESGKYNLSLNYSDIFEDNANGEFLTQYRTVYNSAAKPLEGLIQKGKHAPFSRYAEVLLLASEIHLKSGNIQAAVSHLNQVRDRNKRTLASANLSISAIEDMILDEYKQDMGKEGLYFFALKRFEKAEKTLGIESFRLLLPIPSQAIYSSPKITQNAGY
jgi:tetratricopeptide (TPR) repeat protein